MNLVKQHSCHLNSKYIFTVTTTLAIKKGIKNKCDNKVGKSGFVKQPCYGTCKIVQWATLLLMPKKNFKMLST